MRGKAPLIKTMIFTFIVPGTVTVLIPYLLLRHRILFSPCPSLTNPLSYFAVGGIILGAVISLWCAFDFAVKGLGTPAPIDPPKELLVTGLYKYLRNPMYTGIIITQFSEALLFCSIRLLFYSAAMLSGMHLFVIIYEEPTLERKFGDSYLRYRVAVPRWLPRLKRKVQARP